jgi:hypothetical protein
MYPQMKKSRGMSLLSREISIRCDQSSDNLLQ